MNINYKIKTLTYNICKYIIRILIFINVINNFIKKDYYFTLIGVAAFLLTFIPSLIFKILQMEPDKTLYLSIIIFIFIALYLGTLNNFYRYEWWDTMLHTISGIIIGFFAIIILKKHSYNNSMDNYNKIFIFIFVLSFASLCGVMWEIYEFTIDSLFSLDMQGVEYTGVTDTMVDLIADLIGSIISYIIYHFTYKKQ
ncbi:hypothetical protein ACFLKB_16290 [Clostridium sp. FAM 1755]|uniref:Membrane-spanning protein n=1 Tax=Clostridium botulinum TaxID=1491 RepID=A0A6M0T0Z2_CLOBO|nr:hypothetical protein [Clostridium sporogenes]NFA61053.1 hypothetical protein [Clostridium botulinum]NFI73779.1 hypothetical protein [Clostridium sporogenes]NFL73631.1 hypothetical protein [Clostridium sporogenes]NFM24103.1 hypothetical protein [Clostridium sporogenes]NFP61653.1 hypothetical protein [Clostridium sporogenes]